MVLKRSLVIGALAALLAVACGEDDNKETKSGGDGFIGLRGSMQGTLIDAITGLPVNPDVAANGLTLTADQSRFTGIRVHTKATEKVAKFKSSEDGSIGLGKFVIDGIPLDTVLPLEVNVPGYQPMAADLIIRAEYSSKMVQKTIKKGTAEERTITEVVPVPVNKTYLLNANIKLYPVNYLVNDLNLEIEKNGTLLKNTQVQLHTRASNVLDPRKGKDVCVRNSNAKTPVFIETYEGEYFEPENEGLSNEEEALAKECTLSNAIDKDGFLVAKPTKQVLLATTNENGIATFAASDLILGNKYEISVLTGNNQATMGAEVQSSIVFNELITIGSSSVSSSLQLNTENNTVRVSINDVVPLAVMGTNILRDFGVNAEGKLVVEFSTPVKLMAGGAERIIATLENGGDYKVDETQPVKVTLTGNTLTLAQPLVDTFEGKEGDVRGDSTGRCIYFENVMIMPVNNFHQQSPVSLGELLGSYLKNETLRKLLRADGAGICYENPPL